MINLLINHYDLQPSDFIKFQHVIDFVSSLRSDSSGIKCYVFLRLAGGSFGGKEYRTFLATLPAAVAAQR